MFAPMTKMRMIKFRRVQCHNPVSNQWPNANDDVNRFTILDETIFHDLGPDYHSAISCRDGRESKCSQIRWCWPRILRGEDFVGKDQDTMNLQTRRKAAFTGASNLETETFPLFPATWDKRSEVKNVPPLPRWVIFDFKSFPMRESENLIIGRSC